jgi:Ser/Thr protein kinase RdoA (MazF antagonist)
MLEKLDNVLAGEKQPGIAELQRSIQALLGGPAVSGRLTEQQRLKQGIYRLSFEINGEIRSMVVKGMKPEIAWRNHLVIKRWLPAVGLAEHIPQLLTSASESSGIFVWQVYEDLGDEPLDKWQHNPAYVKAAVELIARLHRRFAGHPLLGECRLWGGDLGIHFYEVSVRDAIHGLEGLQPPAIELSPAQVTLWEGLLTQLHQLLESGGPETFLHGDLWMENMLIVPTENDVQVRLIDWDRAAVGPVTYDLSTFLSRFPPSERQKLLDHYRESLGDELWELPTAELLNYLFDTAERARIANLLIWPAIAIFNDDTGWGWEELAMIGQWFEALEPLLE